MVYAGYSRALTDLGCTVDVAVQGYIVVRSCDYTLLCGNGRRVSVVLVRVAKDLGVQVAIVKRWIEHTAKFPYPESKKFLLRDREFQIYHLETLEDLGGLYPVEELRVCRLAHDVWGNLFPEEVPQIECTIEELSEMENGWFMGGLRLQEKERTLTFTWI